MNDLRVILLLLGIGIIAGVYFWTRFKQRPRQVPTQRRTPVRRAAPDELDAAEIEQELTRMGQLLAEPTRAQLSLYGETAKQARRRRCRQAPKRRPRHHSASSWSWSRWWPSRERSSKAKPCSRRSSTTS